MGVHMYTFEGVLMAIIEESFFKNKTGDFLVIWGNYKFGKQY